MQHAGTIVMVFNRTKPAFGGLAEAGWAALGCLQRGQNMILYVEQGYRVSLSRWMRFIPGTKRLINDIEEYANRARFLVREHAQRLANDITGLVVVDSIDGVVRELRRLYGDSGDNKQR
jgi:hypothetical protein